MKREEPWKVAKREADKLVLRETSEIRNRKAQEQRRLALTNFNPMAIAWGDVTPQPPPKPSSRKSKPKRKEK